MNRIRMLDAMYANEIEARDRDRRARGYVYAEATYTSLREEGEEANMQSRREDMYSELV